MRLTWTIDWINWPVHSQHTSRRNAQRAAIACAQRRRQHETADRYLAELGLERRTVVPRQRQAPPQR